LSDYMIVGDNIINPADAIAQTNATNWLLRYEKYIPGYKWANQADWAVNKPYIAFQDISVNSIVQPGDVFVMGALYEDQPNVCKYDYPPLKQLDVQFFNGKTTNCYTWVNQWGEAIDMGGTPMSKSTSSHIYLFKILNDSIKQGLKPATNPNDFKLIDVIGMGREASWQIPFVDGKGSSIVYTRNPEIYKGSDVAGKSFGVVSPDDVEWTYDDRFTWRARGYGFPDEFFLQVQDLGKHYFIAPTHYMSTVSSLVYKVSEGYTSPQQIRGILENVTVETLLGNVIKLDPGQVLKATRLGSGAELAMGDVLKMNDTLSVLSADSTNITKYVLEVSDKGLSSNAVITSTRFTVTVNTQPKSASEVNEPGSGTVTGFEYGTTIRTIVNNVKVPAGATLSVISGTGAYVPQKVLNFDTTYVSVIATDDVYFEVIAENGTTIINYQLLPQSSESAAFVTSNAYGVIQKDLLIQYVPRGTGVETFLSLVYPSVGAKLKLVDKNGFERLDGDVADDDKLIVTSADGTKTVVYYVAKLATTSVPANTYLAYILSPVYAIDQVIYKIDGVAGSETVSNFLTKVTPSAGASVAVVDKNGAVKINGDINGGDKVRVTSADGKIVVYYTFGTLTGINWKDASKIELYPNPTNGMLNVSGVEKGQRIQVYNAVGSSIIDMKVENNLEIININNRPAGLYMIVVSNQNGLLGKYKAIKY